MIYKQIETDAQQLYNIKEQETQFSMEFSCSINVNVGLLLHTLFFTRTKKLVKLLGFQLMTLRVYFSQFIHIFSRYFLIFP